MGIGAVPLDQPHWLLHVQEPPGPCVAPAPQFGHCMAVSPSEKDPGAWWTPGGGASQTWKVLANSVKDAHASLENSSVAPSGPSLPSFTPTGPAEGRAT